MNILKLIVFVLFIFSSCTFERPKKERIINLENEVSNKELVLIFDRNANNTEFIDRSSNSNQSFQYWREGFEDPNLHISVFHGLEQNNLEVTRKELEKMTVWFDSEMEYEDWFTLNFHKYYMIYQDEYLVQSSLKPDYVFKMYEIKVATGGTE